MSNKNKSRTGRRQSSSLLKGFSLFVCFLMACVSLQAQAKTITGVVVDNTDAPLIGVVVTIEGTTTVVSTGLDGTYSIQASDGQTLVFSFIGMTTQTVTLAGQSVVNIQMEDDATMLTESVVIGYGTARKADLTGSIGRVNAETITRQPSMNAVQAVQGKMSGVNIIASDAPGSSPVVVIRGLGTALGGRNPLYIVDGFPVDNIQHISPSDIVSMDVLKDASSASIYGVRAANGVILITTKKGQKGKAKVTVDSNAGVKTILNKVDMANADQYITYFNEYQQALGATGANHYFLKPASQQPYDTDWYDELLQTGFFNNNAVSISGGGDNVDYYVSYNYYDEKGILDDQSFQRSTIRNNNVYRLFNNRLKITQNVNVSYTKDYPQDYGAFGEAYRQAPIIPTKYSTGRYGVPYVNRTSGVVWDNNSVAGDTYGKLNSYGNPLFTVDNYSEKVKTFTLQGGFEGELKITDFLKANSRFGATKYYYKNRQYQDLKRKWLNVEDPTRTEAAFIASKEANPAKTEWANNSLRLEDVETYRWLWEGYLSFNKSFGSHNVDAVLGMSRERTGIGSTTVMKGYDLPTKEQYWNLNMASDAYAKELSQYSYTPRSLASYFARVQYNFAHKYYFSGTIRRDGSSAFKDSGDRWGTFPSFGLGWTISEESFMKGIAFLDYLKLRGTWGEMGNQDVPLNVSQIMSSTSASDYNYSFGDPVGFYQGGAYGTPAQGLSWEVTRETSLGFDFAMFNQRLNGGFDYYNKTNTNTILYVNPLLNSPYGEKYYVHGAKVNNRGIEFNLSWTDVLFDGFTYEVGMNYSYNKNKVKDVGTGADGTIFDGDTGGSLSNGQVTKRLMEGYPIYGWWLLEADGVWQTQAEIDAGATIGTPAPGYLKYKDQNGDGIIDNRDKVYAGSYLPISTYGIYIRANYRNFDFGIDGYGVAGNKVYNGLKNTRIDGGENIARDTYNDRWTGPGSTNSHPGAYRDTYSSTYYLESGSYFRINNITLGYTFNDLAFKGTKLRLYFTAQNPFMFTSYSGFSPEITGKAEAKEDGSKALQYGGLPNETAGIELSAYPTTRSFLFGVNLQF